MGSFQAAIFSGSLFCLLLAILPPPSAAALTQPATPQPLQEEMAVQTGTLPPPADNPFEENRASALGWIQQILSSYGIGSSGPPPPPQPIDQSKCQPCGCGLTNKKIRIVGGEETQVNEYSWMALLTYRGQFYCGATLISSLYVLTASHCVHGFNAKKIRVRLLEHDQKSDNETQTIERGVQYIVEHAAYDPATIDNDIAIIKLDQAVELDDEFMPVCLPPPRKSFAGEKGIVTGWGVRSVSRNRRSVSRSEKELLPRGAVSPVLQELQVPIMSNEECRSTGYEKSQITDNMLCAGFKEGGKDSCQGDSGGPLHVVDNNYHLIVGVVSWGQGCARPNYPGVYSRVNRYLPWILKHTADSCQCSMLTRLAAASSEGGDSANTTDTTAPTPTSAHLRESAGVTTTGAHLITPVEVLPGGV